MPEQMRTIRRPGEIEGAACPNLCVGYAITGQFDQTQRDVGVITDQIGQPLAIGLFGTGHR